MRVLEGHTAEVGSVLWSRDDHYIVSGGCDGTLRVWKADVQICVHVGLATMSAIFVEYICTCVYMYVCMYVYMYVCEYIYIYKYRCIYIYIYIVYMYMYIYIYTYINVCMYIWRSHAGVCVCVCACVSIYAVRCKQ